MSSNKNIGWRSQLRELLSHDSTQGIFQRLIRV